MAKQTAKGAYLGVEDTPEPPRYDPRPTIVLSIRERTEEIEGLVVAVGHQVGAVVRQRRPRPDPSTFLGRGKLDEVKDLLTRPPFASGGDPLVVVGDALRPSVLFNLEEELGVEVWDRVRLILEIFRRNARVKEARLQVELARLRYELPFVHEALHRRMTGQREGFMGGGEVEARTYETHLKRRTKALLQELERVKKERGTRRIGRRREGLRLVSIAGYTNSGKSSLLNALTSGVALQRNQLFSTLQTTTRRLSREREGERPSDLLFTDTVGFIEDLPPWLIDAFSSTLEEITESDAVLLVIDSSEEEEEIRRKAETALEVLRRIHAPRRMVVLFNKCDLVPQPRRAGLQQRITLSALPPEVPTLFTSPRTGEGLLELVRILNEDILESRHAALHLDLLDPAHVRLESWVRDRTDILQEEKTLHTLVLHLRCPISVWGQLLGRAHEAEASITTSTGNKGGGP